MNMGKINNGGPVFPQPNRFPELPPYLGMTLRDWFAGQALVLHGYGSPEDVAEYVYRVADAMLAERQKGQ